MKKLINYNRVPNWVQVLRAYLDDGYITNGLTIPFLVGTKKCFYPFDEDFSIEDLMHSLSDYGVPVSIMKCDNIGEYVVSILDSQSLDYHKSSNIYKQINNIYIIDDSLDEFDTLHSIISFFEDEYNDSINIGNYSKNFGVWGPFTELDKIRLARILN
jgi:hypothetical protein